MATADEDLFLRFFTWWNGQTFGTQLWTSLHGEFVGEDELIGAPMSKSRPL
jgi:NADH:ubiquinone oxidoreductase subunit